MTEQEMNVAIAVTQGWDMDPPEASEWESRGRWCKSPSGEMLFAHAIPNYTRDLNAMHEAEMSLPIEGVNGQPFDGSRSEFRGQLRLVSDQPYHATALQRAEAFLRTIGKFTPTPTPTPKD